MKKSMVIGVIAFVVVLLAVSIGVLITTNDAVGEFFRASDIGGGGSGSSSSSSSGGPGSVEPYGSNTTICVDECVAGSTKCAGAGLSACGDFDADNCLEWGVGPVCPDDGSICVDGACVKNTSQPSCDDTDGGIDFYEFGMILNHSVTGTNLVDVCIEGTSYLFERHCKESDPENFTVFYECPNGCEAGACIPFVCDDPDGVDFYTSATTFWEGSPANFSDYCLNSSIAVDYSCANNSFYRLEEECPNGCVDGACIGGPEEYEFIMSDYDWVDLIDLENGGRDVEFDLDDIYAETNEGNGDVSWVAEGELYFREYYDNYNIELDNGESFIRNYSESYLAVNQYFELTFEEAVSNVETKNLVGIFTSNFYPCEQRVALSEGIDYYFANNKNQDVMVNLEYVTGSNAKLNVNGEISDILSENEVYEFSDGFEVAITDIFYSSKEDLDSKVAMCIPREYQLGLGTCEVVDSFLESPTDLEIDGREWKVGYSDHWEDEYSGDIFNYVSFKNSEYSSYSRVYMDEIIYSDIGRVENSLNNALEHGLCRQDKVYLDDSYTDYQTVYVCKDVWDVAHESKEINKDNGQNYASAMWISGNRLFRLSSYASYYDGCYSAEDCDRREAWEHYDEQRDIVSFMESLIDNEAEYLDGLYLSWEVEDFVRHFLVGCKSDIDYSEDQSSWYCNTEPVICPPHGEQTTTCRSYNYELGKEEIRERTTQCNPGICSGCMTPKWFGDSMNNKCIEYGFRFEQETGDWVTFEDTHTHEGGLDEYTDTLSIAEVENNIDELEVTINSDNTMAFRVFDWDNVTYNLTAGSVLDLLDIMDVEIHAGDQKILQYLFKVDKVYYDFSNYSQSYFTYTFVQEVSDWDHTTSYQIPEVLDMYCDIDGGVKEQKHTEGNGDWATCQNNFECESNLCSYGECINLKALEEDVSAFKGIFTKITCRLASIFGIEPYNQCLLDRFGEVGEDPNLYPEYLISDVKGYEFESSMSEKHDNVAIYMAEYKYNDTLGENLVAVFVGNDDSWKEEFQREIIEQEMGNIYETNEINGNVVFLRQDFNGRNIFAWISKNKGIRVNLHSEIPNAQLFEVYLSRYPSSLSSESGY